MKKHKTAVLLLPSLITSICVVSGVRITAQDERIKNDGALTACTIKRIVGKSATTLTEPVVVVGGEGEQSILDLFVALRRPLAPIYCIYEKHQQQLPRCTAVAIQLWCLNNICSSKRKRGYSSRRKGTSRPEGRCSFKEIRRIIQ